MAIPHSFIEDLKTRVALSDVVGRRVKLTRAGREYKGLCPFHNEKTPSFTVVEDKGFYHCFGCGAHGTAIDFVMETEGLSFPEAVEKLAAEAGMEVPKASPEEREREKKRQSLYDVVKAASTFFEKTLYEREGKDGLDYLLGRGLEDDVIARFRLGYAPEGRDRLKRHLAGEGIEESRMLEAGLIIKPDDGRPSYDRFRGRVMFPITDGRGRVIAFGGRLIREGEPKYLNSPETPLFHKGRNLYGLAQAREAAHNEGRLVVAEGYTDVIALHQAGIKDAVAPLGTALTEDQIQLMWRIVDVPVLCFDGDQAGQRAAARAADRALPHLKPGKSLKFAILPAGEDPDSLIKQAGAGAMERLINGAEPLSQVLWDTGTAGKRLDTPEDRAGLEKRLKTAINRIQDNTVRRQYLRDVDDRLWRAFRGAFRGTRRGGKRGEKGVFNKENGAIPAGSGRKNNIDKARRQREILLAALILHPGLFDDVVERLGSLTYPESSLDNLRQEIINTLGGAKGLDFEGLRDHLNNRGHADTLKYLLSKNVLDSAGFAKATQPDEVAKEGWEHTYNQYLMGSLEVEIQEARRRLEEDMSDENHNTLQALIEIRNRANELEFPNTGQRY